MNVNHSNQLAFLSWLFLVGKPNQYVYFTSRCQHMNSNYNIDKNAFLFICFYKDMHMPCALFL